MKRISAVCLLAALCLFCLSAAAEETVKFENAGLTLSVPAEYAGLLLVETPENDPQGILFTVTERASLEAARAAEAVGEDEDVSDGAGWLFSIRKVKDPELQKMLVSDMSGESVFAMNPQDATEKFMLLSPTDYRFYRESYEGPEAEAGEKQFSALCEWAYGAVPEAFIDDNRLEPKRYGNSELEMHFARIAFEGDKSYTMTTLERGTVHPSEDVIDENYAICFVEEVTFEELDPSEAPDGEYLVMNFDDGCRLDFFLNPEKPNFVRRVWGEEIEFEELFRVHFGGAGEEEETAAGIMTEWYNALAESGK